MTNTSHPATTNEATWWDLRPVCHHPIYFLYRGQGLVGLLFQFQFLFFLRFMHMQSAKLLVVESHFFLYLFICCIESVVFEFGIIHLVVVQYT